MLADRTATEAIYETQSDPSNHDLWIKLSDLVNTRLVRTPGANFELIESTLVRLFDIHYNSGCRLPHH